MIHDSLEDLRREYTDLKRKIKKDWMGLRMEDKIQKKKDNRSKEVKQNQVETAH